MPSGTQSIPLFAFQFRAVLFEDVPPFTLHILWQSFQYAILTAAEMLTTVTGLIFAYSQAPRRYKSVIMSAWLMTTAVGDLLVVLVAEVRLVKSQVCRDDSDICSRRELLPSFLSSSGDGVSAVRCIDGLCCLHLRRACYQLP